MLFFTKFFGCINWMSLLIFIIRNTNANGIVFLFFFFSFVHISNLTGNFMSLKSSFLAKFLLAFVLLLSLWSAGCKYLTKHHLKHSLSSTFWILVSSIFWWTNSLSNFNNCLHLREYTLKYKYYDKRLNQQCSLKLFLKHFVYLI